MFFFPSTKMVVHSSKESRSLHNFARAKAIPTSTPNINHPKRLVRKYRKGKPNSTLFTEKRLHDNGNEPGESKIKNAVLKKLTVTERKSPAAERKNRNDRANGDVTDVPNPIPDTGVHPTNVYHTTTASPAVTAHVTQIAALPAPTFSPLPPLVSLIATNSASLPSLTTLATSTSSSVDSSTHQVSQPHRLPTPIITLLAVGAACVLLGIFIIIKVCSRPRRRTHPTPSLPILDDPFPDHDKFTGPESPIFGGKERFSPRPGSNSGLWAWTQYPQPQPQLGPIIAKPAQAAGYGKVAGGDSIYGYGGVSGSQGMQEKNTIQYPFDSHPHAHGVSTQTHVYQAPLQQVQSALTRTASRLSTVSTLYPSSPFNHQAARNVGIAVGGPGTAFTADGHHVIKRTKSKATLQKSRSNTVNELGNRYRESTHTRHSQGFPYDGADVTSPTAEAHLQSHIGVTIVPSTSSSGGRSRIKSAYYASGAYPRMSTVPVLSTTPKANTGHSNPFESQDLPPIHKSDSRRNRDTQALASALRLTSPPEDSAPPSPQPTLYPEDSLSVRAPRKHNHKKTAPKHGHAKGGRQTGSLPELSPTMETSAALGSLMLLDFGTTTLGGGLGESFTQIQQLGSALSTTTLSGPSMGSHSNSSKQPSPGSKKSLHSRSDDKPPRVPSPPPLPSLTQMGLEHANPQAYADYRSPTYSIYGLYESDRKSRVGSIGY